jgi:membrane protease YdiL (CAAX protease family)
MDENKSIPQPQRTDAPIEMVPAIGRGWARAALSFPAWIGMLVISAIITYGVLHLSNRPESDLESATNTPMGIVVMLIQLAGTVLVVYAFRRFLDRRSIISLGLNLTRRYVRDFIAGILWGIGLISTVFLVIYFAGGATITGVQIPWGTLATLTVIMFLVGINEELYVRGYLLTNLMESTNKYVALLITSLIFSASHLFNPNWTLIGLANIILAGLLLGIYFVHRRNLWFPIGMHFTWNLFEGTVYGSQVSGVPTPSVLQTQVVGSELLTGGEFGFEASLVATAAIGVSIILVHLIYRPRSADTSQSPPAT